MSLLIAELERLWSAPADPPDLLSLWSSSLAGEAPPAPEELLSALLLDQSRRWQTTQPWPVEKYLSELPQLPSGIDWRLKLASGEFAARRNSNNPLTDQEIQRRFPDIADKISPGNPPNPAEQPTTLSMPPDRGNWIGLSDRYRLDQILGEGAFGIVHRAWDAELERQVAIKVAKPEQLKAGHGPEQYLREAQAAAALSHPNIVQVFDVGRTEDGGIYIVSQLIHGETLEKRLEKQRPDYRATAEMLASVAIALHAAHTTRRLIHRDVKPANILIEELTDKPFVADFGLAIHEDQSLKHRSGAGTPQYMSPEQARGDGHRLDGRSDLFSLGVVLYEMLTGTRPFRGSTLEELQQAVLSGTPAPPRSLQPAIPPELERICLKALAKRTCDRHSSTAEFAADLQAWLQPAVATPKHSTPVKLKPRGLRSFDESDQDFFLELLPGTRNRDLLPESIAFWKQRIEEPDPESTFNIGLIYGLSGCGKSSLVKAGLLPRLLPDIISIYIEATPDTTEQLLARALRRRLPHLASNTGLADLFNQICQTPGPKVAIFLDQFEQWLSANPIDDQQPLVLALRKCDGGRLQTILMVRGDYFPGISRLMHHLEIRLEDQQNCALVDLFNIPHAELVLQKFGIAYDRLPEPPTPFTELQSDFVRQAVTQLASKQQVTPVRLALFAEMVATKPWEPGTLEQMGGLEGIGVAFLEERITRDQRRGRHQNAARRLLKALLPGVSNDIKGSLKTTRELQAEAGYENRDRDFQELLRILDNELRLITPTEMQSEQSTESPPCYQLTHDHLVPSIREWLRINQTPAERTLEDRTWRWSDKRETRQLPSVMEWGQILLRTDRSRWTGLQRTMMRAATRTQTIRGGLALLLLTTVLLLAVWLRQQGEIARAETLARNISQTKTSGLAASLVPLVLLREYALPTLQTLYAESDETSEARLHLSIARLQLGDTDADLLPTARERSLACRPEELQPLTKLLQPWAEQLQPDLRKILQDQQQPSVKRLHAACLLAAWEPGEGASGDTAWSKPETAIFAADQLAAASPVFVGAYQEVLRPQADRLKQSLVKLLVDSQQGEVARTIIAGVLVDYAKNDGRFLTDVIAHADPAADKILFPLLQPHRLEAIKQLETLLSHKLSPEWADPPLNPTWPAPGAVVKTQIAAAHGVLADRYAFCLDMPLPELLSVVETLKISGYRPTRLRPHAGPALQPPRMSAIWVRDGGRFAVQTGMKQEELPQPDVNAMREKLLLADLTLVPGSDPQSGWLALWSEPTVEGEERRCLVGVPFPRLEEGIKRGLPDGGTTERAMSPLTISVHNDHNGNRLYSGVFSSNGLESSEVAAHVGSDQIDKSQLDISTADILINVTANLPNRIKQAKAELDAAPDDFSLRLIYAELCWFARDTLTAAKELNQLWDADYRSEEMLRFRIFALTQLNLEAEARVCLGEYYKLAPPERPRFFVDVISEAFLGNEAAALQLVDQRLLRTAEANEQFDIASCCAVASGPSIKNPTGLKRLRDKALQILELTQPQNPYLVNSLNYNYDFASLQSDPRLIAVCRNQRFASVFVSDPTMETQVLAEISCSDLCREVQARLAEGWRPLAVCVEADAAEPQMVLQRPVIADSRKEALAIRQGSAAVALLRLQATEKIWPLLESSPDPRLRSEILYRLSFYGVDGRALLTQLQAESGTADPAVVARRRGLIQGLGELAATQLLTEELSKQVRADLLQRFRDDPDSGVHGMSEWSLRQLGADREVQRVQQEFRTGACVGGRKWYLTKTGGDDRASSGLSFAIVDATEEFVMGSPRSEAGRYNGPIDKYRARQHRRRIGRVLAIGLHEVTVSQFLGFRPDHDFDRIRSSELDSPINSVSWYDAAAYCNWLSKQEGLPESEWCYEPGENGYAAGMRIKPNFTECQGYRLPTEAEWECVCRGATVTSRYFGETDRLQERYAWYDKNSGNTMLTVAGLRPNCAGIFGLYGNAFEWCMDITGGYPTGLRVLGDFGQGGVVLDTVSRVLRGGSFNYFATDMRSSFRNFIQPDVRYSYFGFRVSRTYPLRP